MTSTPQAKRQDQEIAEIATELGRADISYRYGAIVRDPTPAQRAEQMTSTLATSQRISIRESRLISTSCTCVKLTSATRC